MEQKEKLKGLTWTQMKFQVGGLDSNVEEGIRAGDIYEEDRSLCLLMFVSNVLRIIVAWRSERKRERGRWRGRRGSLHNWWGRH
eukprot:8473508-Alexandrium_andersonii.AAC.1